MWEKNLVIYDQLIASNPNFKRKGKTMPYTSANGYMFSQLNKAGEIGIRLPPEQGKKFIEEYQSGPFYSYGAKMKDYVLVPVTLLENKDLISTLLQAGFEYVMSLPPKKGKSNSST